MQKYRGKIQHRSVHPKIFVWAHTKRAEIECLQNFKNYLRTPLLMPEQKVCWTPWELIEHVIEWKGKEICDGDHDQVWCVFDVDDFYKHGSKRLLNAIRKA